MKYILLLVTISFGLSVSLLVQDGSHTCICEVVEGKDGVKITFDNNTKKFIYGNNMDMVLSQNGEKIVFNNGSEAVSYLCTKWSWVLCGNPEQMKDGSIKWILKHEVNGGIVNLHRDRKILEEYQRTKRR